MSISATNITNPVAGANAVPNTNLHVQATATSSLGEITGWQILLNSVKIYNIAKTATSGILPQALDVQALIPSNTAIGNNQTLMVKAFDSSGASGQATVLINIVQSIAGVITLNVTSPAPNAQVNADGTFHLQANATTTATNITGWQVWFNSVLLYNPSPGALAAIDQVLTVPAGTAPGNYPLTVKAWDNSGTMKSTQFNITVPVPASPPPAQPGTPLGSKLVSAFTQHNVSGAANYNQTNFPTLFTGSTNHDGVTIATNPALNDDSENAAAPIVISKESVHNLMPDGWAGRIGMHCQIWWGRSNHPAIGFDDRDPATMDAIVQDVKDRGYDVIIPDWYSPTKTSVCNDSDIDRVAASCVKAGLNFMVMIDQQYFSNNGYTASTYQAGIIAAIQHLMDKYAAHSQYEHYVYNGVSRPLILLWDIASVGGTNIDWNAVSAAVVSHSNPLLIQYQASGFSVAKSDGSLSWLNTNADTAGAPPSGSSYLTSSFFPACSANQNKICLSSVWKGFNGTLTKSTSWSLGKYLAQRAGQTWLDIWQTNHDYVAGGKRLDFVCNVTLDDYQEGSAVQGGIRTDVAVNWSITGNTANFSVTGNENAVRRYNLWGTTDGITAILLATVTPGQAKTFDLTALPGLIAGGNYTLYLEAQGMPSLENHMAPTTFQRTFVLQAVPPIAVLAADTLSGNAPLTVNFDASQSTDANNNITDYKFDFGDTTAAQDGVNQTAQHVYTVSGTYTATLTVTDDQGLQGVSTLVIKVTDPGTSSGGGGSPTPPPPVTTTQVQLTGVSMQTAKGTTTVYEIPLIAKSQKLTITLNGKQYQLTVRYNNAATAWNMDIRDSKGTAVLTGIPLVTGADLLSQYKYLNLGGQLVVQTDNKQDAIPTLANLGSNSHLFFIVTTPATVAA